MSLLCTAPTSSRTVRIAGSALLLLGMSLSTACGETADAASVTHEDVEEELALETGADFAAQEAEDPTTVDPTEPATPPAAGGDKACCAPADPDCICRAEAPTKTSTNGKYKVASYTIARSSEHGGGTVYYPSDAESPFSGAVYCPPLTGVQAMYRAWGPFLASHGIALVTMDTRSTGDSVQSRGTQLASMVRQFRGEATRAGSPINGKLNPQRIGTMGWSMGGGATWIAAAKDATLKSSISMAGHNMTGGGAGNSRGTKVPSMQLAGQTDTSILGGMGQSQGVYGIIPETTPKILLVISRVGHMTWGGPTAASATGGEMTLAFQKTFLDGDTRWKSLLTKPANASEWKSNINP